MAKCSQCGKELMLLPYKCRYCGKLFCSEHQLPENHDCEGLKKWKRGELKGFKKEVKSKHMTSSEILSSYEPTEFPVPKWLGRIMEDERKKNTLIFAVSIIVILLILLYVFVF